MRAGKIKVVLIGAGNLGTNLGLALYREGFKVTQVYSRSLKSALELASKLKASYATRIEDIIPDADVYFVAVADSAIKNVLDELPIGEDRFVVHTSGSTELSVFEPRFKNYGVMYPLMTFSKFKPMKFDAIPLFIEANTPENQQYLFDLVRKLSTKVQILDSNQRMNLHVSAVFANNFVNHLLTISEDILKRNIIQFSVLEPLIQETIQKALKYSPKESQTGPAVRNDQGVLQKHTELLSSMPEIQQIYDSISKSIIANKNNK